MRRVVREDGVWFYWDQDPHTGGTWGQILRYHALGLVQGAPARDIFGLAPARKARVGRKARAWWKANRERFLKRSLFGRIADSVARFFEGDPVPEPVAKSKQPGKQNRPVAPRADTNLNAPPGVATPPAVRTIRAPRVQVAKPKPMTVNAPRVEMVRIESGVRSVVSEGPKPTTAADEGVPIATEKKTTIFTGSFV